MTQPCSRAARTVQSERGARRWLLMRADLLRYGLPWRWLSTPYDWIVMRFFGGRPRTSTGDDRPVADEFVIAAEDISQCATRLSAFDVALMERAGTPDDLNVRLAVRSLAELGSGMPLSSWAPLHMGGYEASERAWRWFAACARAAPSFGDSVFPVTLGAFAITWDEIAPEMTTEDPVELGLLRAPRPVFAEILAGAVLSGTDLDPNLLIWHVAGKPITGGMAQRGHARVLMDLDSRGQAVHPRAKAIAVSLDVWPP
jgi:hypothetical protein